MEFKEIYNEDLESLNENEEIKKEFKIDTPELANWAVKIVKQEQERLELYEKAIKSEIEMLKSKLEEEQRKSSNSTSWMKFKLNEYLDIVPSKKTKTMVSLTLPYGKIIRKLPKLNFESTCGCKDLKSDIKLIEWSKENAKEFIKTEESILWGELKKDLEIVKTDKTDIGYDILVKSTGEIINCLNVIEEPISIEVK